MKRPEAVGVERFQTHCLVCQRRFEAESLERLFGLVGGHEAEAHAERGKAGE